MARILYLEAAAGFGGSVNSLLTSLKSGLAAWHDCTLGLYADLAIPEGLSLDGIDVMRVQSRLAASRLARLSGRTSRVHRWRRRVLGAGRVSQVAEVLVQAPQVALQVLPKTRAVTQAIAERRIELLHLNDSPSLNLDGMLAAARTGLPCVCYLRSPGAMNLLERAMSRSAVTRFVAVSRAVKDHYVAQGVPEERVEVVHNARRPVAAAPTERARLRGEFHTPEDALVFLFAGRLLARKGVGVLLEAAARLASRHNGLAIWIVGDGDARETLERRARTLGIRRMTRFVGYRRDVSSILVAADVAVVPSVYEDPFPSGVLEAMAAARPVIGSRIGGIPEALEDGVTGFLVAPDDVEALAGRMAQLLASRDLRRAMGRAGLERLSERFDPVKQARLLDVIYQQVLRQHAQAVALRGSAS